MQPQLSCNEDTQHPGLGFHYHSPGKEPQLCAKIVGSRTDIGNIRESGASCSAKK